MEWQRIRGFRSSLVFVTCGLGFMLGHAPVLHFSLDGDIHHKNNWNSKYCYDFYYDDVMISS
jgi:hypothetical protein